jgi:hypothetical protein
MLEIIFFIIIICLVLLVPLALSAAGLALIVGSLEKLFKLDLFRIKSKVPNQARHEQEILFSRNHLDSGRIKEAADAYLLSKPFSRKALLAQLQFDGFNDEDAKFVLENSNIDWNEQSALAASYYSNARGFSREALISQLMFEGFSLEQATYGAIRSEF